MSLTETVTALFYVQVSVFVRSAVSTRDSTSGSLELKLPNPAIMSDATLILSSLVLSIYGAFLGAVFLLLFCPKIAQCCKSARSLCRRKIHPELDEESSSSSASLPDVGQQPSTQTNDDNSHPTDVIVDSTDDASPGALPGEKVRMAFKPRTTT